MVKKLLFTLIVLPLTFCTVFAETQAEVKQMIIQEAQNMNVEPAIVLSIAKTESGFRQNVKSPGGHIGVFQLSPATAKTMGYNPHKTDENIKAGVLYYKKMYDRFGSRELAVAAYNSGPEAVKRNNNKIPANSRNFVNKIMADYKVFKNEINDNQ